MTLTEVTVAASIAKGPARRGPGRAGAVWLGTLCVGFAGWASGLSAQTAQQAPGATLTPCRIATTTAPECGTVSVPEDRGDPGRRSIALNVVVLRATSQPAAPDPVFFVAGGPGTPSTVYATGNFERLFPDRDLVLVDQRGTGASNPLICDNAADRAAVDVLSLADDAWDQTFFLKCLDRLQARADVRFYTTEEAARDLDAVREALGYDQINVMGVSYGTMIAEVYLKRFPAQTRSVILDGVLPLDHQYPLHLAQDVDVGFAAWSKLCKQDAACAAALPDPEEALDRLVADLRRNPVMATITHPVTGASVPAKITPGDPMRVIRGRLRFSGQAATVGRLLTKAQRGDWSEVAATLSGSATPFTNTAWGLYLSVLCSETFPLTEREITEATAGTRMGSDWLRSMAAMCDKWPRGPVPADFRAPVVSDKPVLIMTGAFDGTTPPYLSQRVMSSLSNALDVYQPVGGHLYYRQGAAVPCLEGILRQFVKAADPHAVDVACVADQRAPPFLVDPSGGP